ncbi:MAG: hypothetical protein CMP86_13410, partial [Gammaproteobacteria bacterium]|nr:hypothetical protein [Gammaproteobacteria bacterium]
MSTYVGGDAQNDAQKRCKMQPQVATLMRSLSLGSSRSLVFAYCLSGLESAAWFFKSMHGMQGVSGSNPLGSISKINSVTDEFFGGPQEL